ncbi:hypothetical protein JL475_34710 [Streptomyces sp. M2CJ-2]|uniref:hypothetical protein n=1 Tax=Streptomyces sp. M2CJ-2 TaxID=2803948 RepID=UPI001927E47B|nr:hypothetical protein [Streptomyces sp. M2CJ-2]MBL3671005.1 hypothetical protein [Streptomyces sp. M2CJ-2]
MTLVTQASAGENEAPRHRAEMHRRFETWHQVTGSTGLPAEAWHGPGTRPHRTLARHQPDTSWVT